MQMSNYLDVSIVKDDDQLNAWEQTSFAGFDMPHQTRGQYNKFLNSFDIKKNCRQKLFIAYWHGKPAATALLFFQDDIVGIYFVTTLASYRGNGIASTLVSAVMKYAKSCGSKYCVLQSSEKGLNVYLRAGFKEYCRADVYSLSDQFQDPT
jgi:GNAT superfamily N-acetyltransferase